MGRRVLSIELEQHLAAVGLRLEKGEPVAEFVEPAINGLANLPAAEINRAPRHIAEAAKLYHRLPSTGCRPAPPRQGLTDKEQLIRFPQLGLLFLFHLDGRIREAALQHVVGGLPGPFFFAAIVMRLNDWVEQVRTAAVEAAHRSFPKTSPDIVAVAAETLLLRQDSWGRWGTEREVVDAAFARSNVLRCLADFLEAATLGPSARLLRKALKNSEMDAYLLRLAVAARQPSVRAVAIQALVNGKASWQAGFKWEWVDKSLGVRKSVPRFEVRPLAVELNRSGIIEIAAADRSALVRREALDGIIRHRLDGRQIAAALAHDKSASVRERAEFILNRPQLVDRGGAIC